MNEDRSYRIREHISFRDSHIATDSVCTQENTQFRQFSVRYLLGFGPSNGPL